MDRGSWIILPLALRCVSTGGRNPAIVSVDWFELWVRVERRHTADDHQWVINATEASRGVPEGIAPAVAMEELLGALVSISVLPELPADGLRSSGG